MVLELIIQGPTVWTMLSYSTSLLVVVTVFLKVIGFFKAYKLYSSLPGSADRSYLSGHLSKVQGDGETFIQFGQKRMEEVNARYTSIWLNPFWPDIFVYHPDLVKRIVVASATKSRRLGSPYNLLLPWIGEGLIVANGHKWARQRRLLTPAFHFEILKDYLYIYNEAADRLFKILDKIAETGESVDICPLMKSCTLDVILNCALGFDPDIQGKAHPFSKATDEMTDILFERTRKPWLWPDFLFGLSAQGKLFHKHCDYVHTFSEDTIEQRRNGDKEKRKSSNGRLLNFIDILLDARDDQGKQMTSLEIRTEIDSLIFAGHDTTATAIPWTLYLMAKHTEYQERVQEEVDSILEGRDKSNILWQDLTKLEMLSLCNKEAMRLFPPIPFIQRELGIDVDLDGETIPAGTSVTIATIYLHRNPQIWDDPNEFHPERFQEENKSCTDNYSFIPFSVGARNCIGKNFALNESKVMLARILQRYNVKLAPESKPPRRVPAVVLRSENGIWLTLQRR